MTTTVQEFIVGKLAVAVAKPTDSLIDVSKRMLQHDYSQLPVVDSANKPIGIVTSDSILNALRNYGVELSRLLVKHALDKKPPIFRQDIDLLDLFDDMDGPFVFVVDDDECLVQIITTFDTTEYFRQRARDILLVENIENTLKDYVQLAFTSKSDGEALLYEAVQSVNNSSSSLKDNFAKAVRHYLGAAQERKGSVSLDDPILDEVFEKYLDAKKPPVVFDDLTLANYISLFLYNDNWTYLESVFELEKAAIVNLLDAVRLTRNALSHFREIGADQSRQLRDCYDLLVGHQDAISTVFAMHADVVTASVTTSGESVEPVDGQFNPVDDELMPGESRYAALAIWLQEQPPEKEQLSISFEEVEEIIGGELPGSAYKNRSWWANDSVGHVQSKQWLDVNWRVAGVNMTEKQVRFARIKDRQRAYIDFYNELIDELRKMPGYEQIPSSPDGSNWYSLKSVSVDGRPVAWLNFAFGRGGVLRVELYIDTGDKETNKQLFDTLDAERNEIEEEVGNELEWQRLNNRRASRVARVYEGRITDSEEDLHALVKKAAPAMAILSKVAEPRIVEIAGRLH